MEQPVPDESEKRAIATSDAIQRTILKISIIPAVVMCSLFLTLVLVPAAQLIWGMSIEMHAGPHYTILKMPRDILFWIKRSRMMLSETKLRTSAEVYHANDKPITDDLKKRRVSRIDVADNSVSYVLDCGKGVTEIMQVIHKADGSFEVDEEYNHGPKFILWPPRGS